MKSLQSILASCLNSFADSEKPSTTKYSMIMFLMRLLGILWPSSFVLYSSSKDFTPYSGICMFKFILNLFMS